jgi:two-component system response regulator (stage 0 sporulation protein A)
MTVKKIFIIEDDANLLYGLESQFSADEFEIETSIGDEEMEELISRLKDAAPDYVILDLILPKLDGFEIIKKMKADDELNDKQIFIFTDLSDEDSRQRSLILGADYVFFKDDFDTFEFAEKFKKIVANQGKNDDRDYEE